MKTVKFVVSMVLLAVIFVAFLFVLSYTYFHKKTGLSPWQEKFKKICIIAMIAAFVVVVVLMAI